MNLYDGWLRKKMIFCNEKYSLCEKNIRSMSKNDY